MPKSSREVTRSRRDEIVDACEKLYRTMSFKEMTMQEIGRATSFTRTSIYNYFHTKEEIFLALLQREYGLWIRALYDLRHGREYLSRRSFAGAFAWTLQDRKTLLKLLSMNHYDLEENSRLACVVAFKKVYVEAKNEVDACLQRYAGEMTPKERDDFIYSFFPFMFGIYPYTEISEKQKEAMELAGMEVRRQSIYEITYREVKRLLCVCDREDGEKENE